MGVIGNMVKRVSGWLALGGAVGAGLVVAAPATALSPAQAVRACAGGRSVTAQLSASDLPFLRQFVPCFVGKLRGSKTFTSKSLSNATGAALLSFARSPHNNKSALVKATGDQLARHHCSGGGWRWGIWTQDTNPHPPLTPSSIGKTMSSLFAQSKPWADAGGVFGFAYLRNVLFHDGPRRSNSVSAAVYVLDCPGT